MKFSKYILLISIFASAGCLKDKSYDDGMIQSVHATSGVPNIIEIKLTATNATNLLSLSFANSSTDTVIDLIPVNLATAAAAPEDIHVTLKQNDQLVTDYNAENTDTTVSPGNPNPSGKVTHYVVPTMFSIVNPNGVVIIPKGSHTGYLQIKFKPSDFLGQTYALGYSLDTVAESGYLLSGNLQNGIVVINIKNQYDGNYHASGVRTHPTLGPFPFSYDADLNTADATSVTGNVLADLQEAVTITINPDNTLTLSSARGIFPTPGGVNKYDPATQTFTLNYYYNTAAPRIITETLVKNP